MESGQQENPDTSAHDRCIGLLFKIAFLVGILIVILVLIILSIGGEANFVVENISLTQFDFGSKNTLQYNLAFEIAVRNPYSSPIYYDEVEVSAYYNGQRFETQTLTPFCLPHKSTQVLNPVFEGKNSSDGASELSDELKKGNNKDNGPYQIGVKLYVKYRYGLLGIMKSKSTMQFCFMVPLDHHHSKSKEKSQEATNCVDPRIV